MDVCVDVSSCQKERRRRGRQDDRHFLLPHAKPDYVLRTSLEGDRDAIPYSCCIGACRRLVAQSESERLESDCSGTTCGELVFLPYSAGCHNDICNPVGAGILIQCIDGRWNRVVLISWAIIALVVMAGGTLANETLSVWEGRSENQAAKRDYQVYKGIKWAKYATGSVMAPIMFVLPFPTMVDVDEQYNQQLINGGNYVRNFFGIFTLIALFSAIFVKKNWRDLALIGSFIISYLGVICMSGFANSERFLLPGLPFLLLMAAYGVSLLDERNFKWVRIWYYIVPVMVIGWAVFKLGSRGIL